MRLSCLLGVLLLGACSSKPVSYTPEDQIKLLPDAWATIADVTTNKTDLLNLVADTNIEPWIELLLHNNPALQIQMLEIAKANWQSQEVAAQSLPNLSLTTTANNKRQNGISDRNYTLALTSSWELDLWQKLANQHDASKLDTEIAKADFIYAQRSLAASFIKSWLTWVNAQQQLDNNQAQLKNLALTANLIQQRYITGLGKLQDLDTAQADQQELAADVAAQQTRLINASYNLQQLLGEFSLPHTLPNSWPQIEFPHITLPAQVVGQRPDLQAAYQKIRAADLRSQVAYKQLLPQLSLNLDLSKAAQNGANLLDADPLWTLLAQLTQPLFDGGKRQAQLQIQQQLAAQAYWSYREVLLNAILEVETALTQEQGLAKQYTALGQALQFAQLSEWQFEQRYQQGLTDIQSLLTAKRKTFTLQSRLLQVGLERALNRIDLGLALGLPVKHGAL